MAVPPPPLRPPAGVLQGYCSMLRISHLIKGVMRHCFGVGGIKHLSVSIDLQYVSCVVTLSEADARFSKQEKATLSV